MNNVVLWLLPIFTSLPDDLETFWNYDILGYTTVGTIVAGIASVAYVLIKARLQRKAINKGLTNSTMIENAHYKDFLEYRVNSENRIKELERDMVKLAEANIRKEAKEIAHRRRMKMIEDKENNLDIEKTKEVVENVVHVVKETTKKMFR